MIPGSVKILEDLYGDRLEMTVNQLVERGYRVQSAFSRKLDFNPQASAMQTETIVIVMVLAVVRGN